MLKSLDAPRESAAHGEWRTIEPVKECQKYLNHKPFRVLHGLNNHPLFSIDALLSVAEQAAKRPSDLYFDSGNVAVTDKWGDIPIPELPIKDVIDRIENAGAWIVMKHIDVDPRYRKILDEWVEFTKGIADPELARDLIKPELIAFITSPGRVTPFHFDTEVNFLAQIQGTKEVWVCDPADRSIISEDEIESYYAVSVTVGNYRPDVEEKAAHFVLKPGDAVHIPCHAAHWVKNGNDISISLSLNFELPRWKNANVYRANHYLRRLGVRPRSPGQSKIVDGIKSVTIDAAHSTYSASRHVGHRAAAALAILLGGT